MKKHTFWLVAAFCIFLAWTLWPWNPSAQDSGKPIPRRIRPNQQNKQSQVRQAVRPLQLSQQDKPSRTRMAAYGKLPLSFEVNQGQSASAVKFLSRGGGYTMFLTGDEAVLALRNSGVTNQESVTLPRKAGHPNPKVEFRNSKLEAGFLGSLLARLESPISSLESGSANLRSLISDPASPTPIRESSTTALRMRLVGASPSAVATGAEELCGKVNYFNGNNPKKWRSNVPTYAKVRFKDVYPGIDLVYYGNHGGQLEYDFLVAPGANPSFISLAFDANGQSLSRQKVAGRTAPAIDAHGDLVVPSESGELRLRKPVVYQEQESGVRSQKSEAKNSPSNRQSALDHRQYREGRLVLDARNHVRIALGPYDHSKPLVIDPALIYSTYLGGSNSDVAKGIAVDSSGNVYVTGETNSPDFPTVNPLQASLVGTPNAFVTKLSWNGTSLSMVYSTYLGGGYTGSGANASFGNGIAVDSSGNAYVTGLTTSPNFPTANPIQAGLAGFENAFVAELNSTGSALVYCTYLGGSLLDSGQGIAVDHAGNAYVTGMTQSADFPTIHAYQSANGSATLQPSNAFVAKLNWSGSALSLVYSTYLGGSTRDFGRGIAVDSAGNAYVTGSTSSKDFPTTPGAFQTSLAGVADAFVSKLSWNGNVLALAYSTLLGGTFDGANGIAVDSSGNAYVTGQTFAQFTLANPLPSSSPGIFVGGAFLSKLNPAGSGLVYSTYLGGVYESLRSSGLGVSFGGTPSGNGIAVDSSGNAYITGTTAPLGIPVENPLQASSDGSWNAFVAELSWNGSALGLVYCTYLGGSGADSGGAIAVDSSGNAYVAGQTNSADFPTANPLQESLAGLQNAFVAKISAASGTGITLSTNTVIFSDEPVDSTSSAQSVTLTNSGTGPAAITAINVSGDYALTTTSTSCPYNGGSVPSEDTCTIDITFTPEATGRRNGSVTVNDNAGGGPQSITLLGVGISGYPMAQVTPGSLTFGSQNLGTTSAPQPITVTNTGATPLTITGFEAGSNNASVGILVVNNFNFNNFNVSINCGQTIAAGSSCTMNVAFSPTVDGLVTATLTVVDNSGGVPAGGSCTINIVFAPLVGGLLSGHLTVVDNSNNQAGSVQSVSLTGWGEDFTLATASGSSSSATAAPGQTATYALSLGDAGVFNNSVALTCTGAPAESACTVAPNPAARRSNITVSVATTAPSAVAPWAIPPVWPHLPLSRTALIVAVLLAGATWAVWGWKESGTRWRRTPLLPLAAGLLLILVMAACGGGNNRPSDPGTPAGTYVLTVTGTAGSGSTALSHNVTLTLTVR